MNRKLVLVLVLLIVPMISRQSKQLAKGKPTDEIDNPEMLNSGLHDPILITSDEDFENQGWPGNGTKENPYVIANLTFDNTELPYINITNVKSIFAIENCFMPEASEDAEGFTFIVLSNVTDCIINGNTFESASDAIYVRNAARCYIENNRFSGYRAIHTIFVRLVVITRNSFVSGDYALLTSEGVEGIFTHNYLENIGNIRFFGSYFKFTSNTVIGNLRPSIYASTVNISSNVFSGRSFPLRISGLSSSTTSLIMTNNSFTSYGMEVPFTSTTIQHTIFKNNTVQGVEIPFVSGLTNETFNCQGYPQVIAFNCTGVSFLNANFSHVGTGLALFSSIDCKIPNAHTLDCRQGILLDTCHHTRIENLSCVDCNHGIEITRGAKTRIISSIISSCYSGIDLSGTHNTSILNNRIQNNDYGIILEFTSGSYVVGNTFSNNTNHVKYDWALYPIDKWDDGNGTGNAWDTYLGIGSYILDTREMTIADHYPTAVKPWHSTGSGFVLIAGIAILAVVVLLTLMAFIWSKRNEGHFASVLEQNNNQLFFLGFCLLFVVPHVFVWNPSEYYGDKWWLASESWVLWGDHGWTYLKMIVPVFSHSPYYGSSIGNIVIIGIYLGCAILLKEAWDQARFKENSRNCARCLVVIFALISMSATMFTITPYESTYNYIAIPFPLSPLLLYPLLQATKKEEKKERRRMLAEKYKGIKCVHCGAVYVYDEEDVHNRNKVTCQNCGKEFELEMDSNSPIDSA